VLALVVRDNSIVDIFYGGAFVLGSVIVAILAPPNHPRQFVILTLTWCWGARLGIHLFVRNRGRGEDFRYKAWRQAWGRAFVLRSFLQIYMLQGAVVMVVLTPVLVVLHDAGRPWGVVDSIGLAVWTVGFLFEAVSDYQLLVFKRTPGSHGRIMTTGLWRYSRHPNYFGEVTLWWGVCLISLLAPGGAWSLISPLTISWLLLRVSGIPMLEAKYAGTPDFEDYKRRTSAFFPWIPRENHHSTGVSS
jgi:steroid 5-alpha reductase family enzyme